MRIPLKVLNVFQAKQTLEYTSQFGIITQYLAHEVVDDSVEGASLEMQLFPGLSDARLAYKKMDIQ